MRIFRITSGGAAALFAALSILSPPACPAVEMVAIPGGEFLMGSPETELRRGKDKVQRRVEIAPFLLAKHEVTQAEYRELMGDNPSHFQGDELPVENVTWFQAAAFCNALSVREGLTPAYAITGEGDAPDVQWNREANGYRLPTEAEWEYACRAGSGSAFNTGGDITDSQANFYAHYSYKKESPRIVGGYRQTTLPPGGFAANAWGLFDMHGNVWEWCWDWYGPYAEDDRDNPAGPESGQFRVHRGGGWNDFAKHIRSAYRAAQMPENPSYNIGLRPARNAK